MTSIVDRVFRPVAGSPSKTTGATHRSKKKSRPPKGPPSNLLNPGAEAHPKEATAGRLGGHAARLGLAAANTPYAPKDPRQDKPAKEVPKTPRGPLSDPKIHPEDKEVQYAGQKGKIAVDGMTATDPDQAGLGDCWLMSSLSSVAHAQPELLNDSIRKEDNGTYSVRLFPGGREKWINVDADLPQNKDGSLAYASSTDESELWPSLFEKAYAKQQGGYAKLDGGFSYNGMTMLTGKRSDRRKISRQSDTALWQRLRHADDNNKPITASTYGGEKKHVKSGLVEGHAYSVVGTQRSGEGRFVVLRNPWAHGEYRSDDYKTDLDFDGDGKLDGDEGVFRMRLDDFRKHFKATDMNDPPRQNLATSAARWAIWGARAMGPLVPIR